MDNNVIESINNETNPTISINNDNFFNVSLYKKSFLEEKELIKFIKNVERIVRASTEYNELIAYMRRDLNLNYCTFLNNIDSEKVVIEFHHTIFSLFDIVSTIINMYEKHNKPFNSLIIASHVLELHYKNLCGLIPLSKSMHQLVHSDNSFFIHKDLVLGNVDDFFNKFKDYMSEDLINKYAVWSKYSEENPMDSKLELDLFSEENRDNHIEKINSLNISTKSIEISNSKEENKVSIDF